MASILAQRIVVMYPFRTSHVFYFIPNFDHFFLRSPSNDIEGYSVHQSRSNKMRAKVYILIVYILLLLLVWYNIFALAVLGREMASIKYQFDTLGAFFPRPRSLEHSISISNTCISASFLPPFLRVPEKCSLKTFRPSLEY